MNNLKDIKFALYARKSSIAEDKQMQSVESQISEMKSFALKNDYKIVKTFVDRASAHKPNSRPEFKKMMSDIDAGKIDGILCWKADRASRNPIDGGQILYSLQRVGGLKVIKTPYQQYLPTDNTLPLTIELGMANQYSLDLSKNVKRGNKTKIEKGGICGVVPAGYLNDKINKTAIPDPERFHLVRRLFELYMTGQYSISELCTYADKNMGFRTLRRKKQGGNPLTSSSLYKILVNPFYYGKVVCGENENWGIHRAMLTAAEFEKVQQMLMRNGHKGKVGHTKYEFSFTGCIKCGECNSGITATEKVKYACPNCRLQHSGKNPHDCKRCGYKITKEDIAKGNFYKYYSCTKKVKKSDRSKCEQRVIREEQLEKQFLDKLEDYEIHPKFEKCAIKWLKYVNDLKFAEKKKDNTVFLSNYKKAESRLKNLFDMRLSNEITSEEFAEHKKQFEIERDECKSRLDKAESRNDEWVEKAEEILDFMSGIALRFKDGTIPERKYIFQTLGKNLFLNGDKLGISIRKKYILAKNMEKDLDSRIEPPKNLSETSLERLSDDKYLSWLG